MNAPLKTSRVSRFDELLRDLARRNLDREPITRPEMAVVMTEYPDVVYEALDPELIAYAFVTESAPAAIGQSVIDLLRVKCMAYIRRDLERTRGELVQEELEDKEFA